MTQRGEWVRLAAMPRPELPPRAALVDNFADLVARPFVDGRNALCLPRALDGDFGEVARLVGAQMGDDDDLVVIDDDVLRTLPLSPAGRRAAEHMREDHARLAALGRDPTLNCIRAYARDTRGLPIATDVMSFHVDRAPIEVDTFLCTYHGDSSLILDNDDAVLRLDDDGARERLRIASGCSDDEAFVGFLRDGSFDLHYRAVEHAREWSCGVGALWKLAVAWPGSPVPPCIHRAPSTMSADPLRLLLIC